MRCDSQDTYRLTTKQLAVSPVRSSIDKCELAGVLHVARFDLRRRQAQVPTPPQQELMNWGTIGREFDLRCDACNSCTTLRCDCAGHWEACFGEISTEYGVNPSNESPQWTKWADPLSPCPRCVALSDQMAWNVPVSKQAPKQLRIDSVERGLVCLNIPKVCTRHLPTTEFQFSKLYRMDVQVSRICKELT